jgi:dienelactone hydrolase
MTVTTPRGPGSLAVLTMLQEGRFEEIRDLFAPALRSMVAPEALKAAWEAVLSEYGPFSSAGVPVTEPAGPGAVLVKIPVSFARGEATVILTANGEGQLAGLQLAPASAAEPTQPWQPPAYVDTGAFEEQDVTLGEGPLAVPGTLSLPRNQSDQGGGPYPAVVLLAGSGPADRDETFGRNKPFKDLAWGLASRGVAVLRFDKVTSVHPAEVREDRSFTPTAEYVPAATAAIQLLQNTPGVDPGRVFVLGHSEGGTMAPRVAAAGPSAVAGLVIMAGGTEPLHWAAVRQIRYIASLNPSQAAASGAAIEAITRQAQLVDSPDLTGETPDSELPFGAPAAYWLDLRGYDPAATAAALGKPDLILQGGRDYQATVEDDLPSWQAALAGRPDVVVRVYDQDNHLFFTGSGPSTPAEYEPVQHMDPAVIADIASWLTQPHPPAA